VLPSMIERGVGHVVNIGSVAGLYPMSSGVYGASKGAIHFLSTNLRLELAGTGIRVTEICPGRVRTEFYDAAIDDPDLRDAIKETGVTEITSEDVAAAIAYALDAPWYVNVARIELQPTEQTYGGMQVTPIQSRDQDQ
jgi:NADP-dependent 3-hydroxy acid dehydrogenase YdfG